MNDEGNTPPSAPVLGDDGFPPASSLVSVDFGARSHPGHGRATNDDHFLIVRLGRHQDVVATSLPEGDVPNRFDEAGFGMVVADGMGCGG